MCQVQRMGTEHSWVRRSTLMDGAVLHTYVPIQSTSSWITSQSGHLFTENYISIENPK